MLILFRLILQPSFMIKRRWSETRVMQVFEIISMFFSCSCRWWSWETTITRTWSTCITVIWWVMSSGSWWSSWRAEPWLTSSLTPGKSRSTDQNHERTDFTPDSFIRCESSDVLIQSIPRSRWKRRRLSEILSLDYTTLGLRIEFVCLINSEDVKHSQLWSEMKRRVILLIYSWCESSVICWRQ